MEVPDIELVVQGPTARHPYEVAEEERQQQQLARGWHAAARRQQAECPQTPVRQAFSKKYRQQTIIVLNMFLKINMF